MTAQYSQKYTVICFLEHNPGLNFPATEWPLHITLLDTFKTDWQVDKLASALGDLAEATRPFTTLVTNSVMLGENKDEPVKLLASSKDILRLHHGLLLLGDKASLVFNTPEFVGNGFLPHITDQRCSNVEIGKSYQFSTISLVDMFPNSDHLQRKILFTYNLVG